MSSTKTNNNDTSRDLLIEQSMEEPLERELPFGTAVVLTIARDVSERPNQDAAGIFQAGAESALLVVADGMGGTRRGAAAAAAAISHLASHLPEGEENNEFPMRTAILNGIEAANEHIVTAIPESGTTLAAVELRHHVLRPYHIGDSTILVTGQRGKLKFNTVSHSPVGFAVEAGLLDEDEALHHDARHLISNALGFPEMRIELGAPMELARFDTLLIASDGITDNLFIDDIIKIVRKGRLAAAVVALAKLARERMATPHPKTPTKPDDLTMIAYRRNC